MNLLAEMPNASEKSTTVMVKMIVAMEAMSWQKTVQQKLLHVLVLSFGARVGVNAFLMSMSATSKLTVMIARMNRLIVTWMNVLKWKLINVNTNASILLLDFIVNVQTDMNLPRTVKLVRILMSV